MTSFMVSSYFYEIQYVGKKIQRQIKAKIDNRLNSGSETLTPDPEYWVKHGSTFAYFGLEYLHLRLEFL